MTKTVSVSASRKEGRHSTKGTSYLLEDQKYIPCSWFPCHRYGTDDSDTSTRPTSHIYLEPDTSPNYPSRIINSASITNIANRLKPHTRHQRQENRVHSDVCGPMPHQSLGGASYFISFINDSTRKVWAYRLEQKIECSRSSKNGSPTLKISLVES